LESSVFPRLKWASKLCGQSIAFHLPQIETKSILTGLAIFSWQKRATSGSYFFDLEKKARE
jgi:hypothetical protein